MPTYEYVCDSCGHNFEMFQRMSDEPISVCPKCKGSVHKVLSGGLGINFRGSGFYINDSHTAPPAAANSNSPAKSSSGGGCSG
ncbi:FmdB family zinc ribbon protein [Treponema pedis]|uniref:FmdB family zinc ribbon protein n=1 Tax=Treponema pedis TaxID=409322 RepID=UPI0003F936C3|nr:FmdB family zinc ribbon protein [Treponema pedis]